MPDPTSDPTELISEATKVLAEPVSNVLSPPTKEMGELLGTIANLCRFYATENLARIFTKWAEYRRGERPLNGDDFRKVMPLLPAASMVTDEELQARWVRLMESAITNDGHSPAFGQTLSQLSVEDVRMLDRLWASVLVPSNAVTAYTPPMRPLSFTDLVRAFDAKIETNVNHAVLQVYQQRNRWSEEQQQNYERLQQANLIIDNVVRLGILRMDQKIRESDRYVGLDALDEGRREVKIKAGAIKVRTDYSFASYGVSFMEAVTRKEK
ncbi:MAG TPA: hypothetical protein VFU48_12955 [Nitrospira sp.]|nr:hypothetical protein [Nitrospira sp.]